MTLLQPATSAQPFAKVGLYGKAGSGKTLTATFIALGLSKERHNSAPIALVDTEQASEFILPICEAEGVPLITVRSRSFVDMRAAHQEAQEIGCCALLVDSYSQWAELNEAFKAKLNLTNRRLQYQHREELWRLWGEWTREMRASPLHVFLAGRLSYDYGDDEDDAGDPRLVKLGTKMRGEADAGYEPNLLIELEALADARRDPKSKSKRGTMIHYARVLKDRTMMLNGRTFAFKDLNDYHVGDYHKVFQAFAPHIDRLGLVHPGNPAESRTVRAPRSSADLFSAPSGESAFAERQRRVTIACEEIQASLRILWPGQDAGSKICREAAIDALFHTRSWSAVEHLAPEVCEAGGLTLRACETACEQGEPVPMSRAEVIAFVLAVRETRHQATVL